MILVTGATGTVGRRLVHGLREAGVPFRALVRTPDRGRESGGPFVVGDFDDPPSVAAALHGVDRLFLDSGGALPVPGPQPVVRQQTTVVDLAAAAGITHVVKVSAWRARVRAALSVGAHGEIERHLGASGLAWSSLRPTGFMQNFATGAGGFARPEAVAGPYGAGRVAYVDAGDVAACALALLTGAPPDPDAPGIHELTGPEALTHREIADLLGRPFHDLPPAEAAADLRARGLPDWFVADLLALHAEMAAGDMATVSPTVHELTGRPPRSFAAYAAGEK
ncbi:NAD(P)H-binding protein [Streptomyces sp. LE64]|uniref:NAD(P)H-binding protein n=1 Tax=Streptomyces sp. LE64 TaxID=3448653 RepID=UPI00404135BB